MNKGIITVAIALIILASVITMFYFKFERNGEETKNIRVNYTVYAEDYKRNKLQTGITIESQGNVLKNITTAQGGAVLIDLPVNRTFSFYNYNLEGQNYYTDVVETDSKSTEIHRIAIDLEEAGDLEISSVGDVLEDEEVVLTLISDGLFKHAHFCLKWSPRIISVKSNLTQSETLEGYSKCYYTNVTLKNSKLDIPLKVKRFGDLIYDDKIEVFVYDADLINQEFKYNDVGSSDYEYIIINNIFKT